MNQHVYVGAVCHDGSVRALHCIAVRGVNAKNAERSGVVPSVYRICMQTRGTVKVVRAAVCALTLTQANDSSGRQS